MKAVVFDEGLKLDNDYKKPVPQKGEALVRVTLAGICNTDYRDYQRIYWATKEF